MTTNINPIPVVDLHLQYLGMKEEIDEAIARVIGDSGFIRSRYVEQFEEDFARMVGVRHCVSCGNGTDALYIAMKGLGIKPGDEVITTAHSWISTSETISQAGGTVIFCDTEPHTLTIDTSRLETLVSPRTVGIIPVHLYGQAARMDEVMNFANKHNLWVIEDCAQAHLAQFRDKTVGTFGNAATFSFYPGKNLGAMGDAGCIVTNDSSLASWCELYSRHGGKGEHLIEGINSRLDGLQAAVLSVKLPRLTNWNELRQGVAYRYSTLLDEMPGIQLPTVRADSTHVFHLYVIRTEQREDLRQWLTERGISTSVNYPRALPFLPAYSRLGHRPEDFPQAHADQDRVLSLPMFPEMSDSQILKVVDAIRSFVESH